MTSTELELVNRWLKLYEKNEVLYSENIRLEEECSRLKIENQSLRVAFEQKSSFLTQVLKDMSDRDKKENEMFRQMDALKERNRRLTERLSKCRRLFADDANKNNPNWPPLDIVEMPPLKITIDEEQVNEDDILSAFKQSSKGI